MLSGAPEGFDALVLADIARSRGGLTVFVARDSSRASAFIGAMGFFAPEMALIEFPAWDCLPYDRVGPSAAVAADRMATLSRLSRDNDPKTPAILITTAAALVQRLPPRNVVREAGYSAKVGATVEIADLERYFAVNGYHRASTVSEQGEFAVRGGVIDVFPPSAEEPVRLDLFGDTLESIRGFDRETQRSTKQHHSVDLLPVSEALLDKTKIQTFRQGYLAAFGAPGDDPLYATVSEGGRRAGMEHWLPLFYGELETLFDYLPGSALVAIDNLADRGAERTARPDPRRLRRARDRRSARRTTAPSRRNGSTSPPRSGTRVSPCGRRGASVRSRASRVPGTLDLGAKLGRVFASERAQDSVNLFEATADHARELAKAGKRVIFASWSEGSSDRLGVMLADHGLKGISLASYWQAAKAADPKKPQRAVLPLESGFETDNLAVISETDILGDRLARPRRKRRAANFLAEATA